MDTPHQQTHSADGKSPAGPDHGHDHGGNTKYYLVFLVLCVLTGASFLTFFPFWNENVPESVSRVFMMAVSCTKAFLVMAFFMHLIQEANWKYVLTIPAGMMSIFLILMLVPDIGFRYDHYANERLIHSADPDTGTHTHGDHSEHEGESHETGVGNEHAKPQSGH